MRQFNFEPDDDGYDDMEGMEEMNQFIVPTGIEFFGPDTSAAELQKALLATTLQLLEKSWFWCWYSPEYKLQLFLQTYLAMEQLLIQELEPPKEE